MITNLFNLVAWFVNIEITSTPPLIFTLPIVIPENPRLVLQVKWLGNGELSIHIQYLYSNNNRMTSYKLAEHNTVLYPKNSFLLIFV